MIRQLLEALTAHDGPTNPTALARDAGISRGTIEGILDGGTRIPRDRTLERVEQGSRMPPGTIADYIAGRIDLDTAVRRYGTHRPDDVAPDPDRSTQWRLSQLEDAVARLREQVELLLRDV